MGNGDRLTRFRKPTETTMSAESKPAGEKPAYVAFQPSKDTQRHLEIRLKYPDPAELPLNAMITNMRVEWRWGIAITLIYGNNTMVVKIRGERLQPLATALREWKVEWIAEADPETFGPPADDTAPYIESIEVITERPEAPPPMSQRH